jgi:hypothetical protein
MRRVSEYIVNPRRAPRAPSRCSAQVQSRDASWTTETEDIGPSGCQLVAPRAVARGLRLTLVFTNPRVPGSLRVEGKVAWVSPQAPWRVGVAFDDYCRAPAEHWFAQLVAAFPGLGSQRRVPERLPVDSMLFLAPPPTLLVDFTAEEVGVLRHVANGTTIASLRDRLVRSWGPSQRAVFSLLARGLVTVTRAAAAHPAAWKKVMEELGVEFVTEAPREARSTPSTRAAGLELDLGPEVAPPLEFAEPPRKPLAGTPGKPPPAPARPAPPAPGAPGASSAGTGWRGGAPRRSRDAQECFDLGRAELTAGRASSALAHLRRALQLAPGDAEIAGWIGRALKGPPSQSS